MVLDNFQQLSVMQDFWAVHPFVIVKVSSVIDVPYSRFSFQSHFFGIVDKISHETGVWLATLIIEDDTGYKLEVLLSNQVNLVGYCVK